jgi:predicted nuclease of predicted toxin-antitoxin system
VRFLVDAQLPPALCDRLAAAGHVAEHVHHIGLGAAPDGTIWAHASAIGATLVSKDEDFAVLAQRSLTGPAVVWIRLGNTTNAALWNSLEPILAEIVEALERGERLVEVM